MMPAQTRMKANNVPMLVRSTISSMLAKDEMPPTMTPVQMVVMWGVLYFGWAFAAHAGSSPSRAIEKKMRG